MESVRARQAAHGQKMIELKVRFWTNDIAEDPGKIIPKTAWSAGIVRLATNNAHDIRGSRPIPFNSLLDVGSAIEQCLIDGGIKLRKSRRMRRYVSADG